MKFLIIFLIISMMLVPAQNVFAEENLCISRPSQFAPLKLQYSFDGTGTVENICISSFRSILVYVNGTNDSSITINIPKNFLCFLGLYDAQYGDQDLIVLINGREVDFTQSMRKNSSQDITINVKEGRNEIEIIGGSLINPTLSCLSPKLQQYIGISDDQIMCRKGLQLVFKYTNDTSVCVTYHTGVKLIERGWGTCVGHDDHHRGTPCGFSSSTDGGIGNENISFYSSAIK